MIDPRPRGRRTIADDALDPLPRWLVRAWGVLSVVPAGRRRRGRDDWRVAYSTLLAASCAYVAYAAPQLVCALQHFCDASPAAAVKAMFPQVVAAVCLASRLNALLAGRRATAVYERHVAGYRALQPVTRAEADALSRFACRVALVCALLVGPMTAVRLWRIFGAGVSGPVAAAAVLLSVQNFSTYCAETHFAALCHALCRMFAAVNRDLASLRADVVARNRYPSALGARSGSPPRATTAADNAFGTARIADRVRRLRTMHGHACEAAVDLDRAFGVHLGLSLCALSLYFMFDVYYHILGILDNTVDHDIMFCCWIAQYVVRFTVIVVVAHAAAKQASESEILLTDINNRFLDKNTKEEIQLFLNQICSQTIKFTARDFFTLNINLISSAVAVGITYLVILLQFNSSNT